MENLFESQPEKYTIQQFTWDSFAVLSTFIFFILSKFFLTLDRLDFYFNSEVLVFNCQYVLSNTLVSPQEVP